jgi:hypothetical protein
MARIEVTQAQVSDNACCSICIDDFELGEVCMQLPCFHSFHPECVSEWFAAHYHCPNCRHEVKTDDAVYEREKEKTKQKENRERGMHKYSIRNVKAAMSAKGVDFKHCIEKKEILQCYVDSCLSIRDIKSHLRAAGSSFVDCIEAQDFRLRMLELVSKPRP